MLKATNIIRNYNGLQVLKGVDIMVNKGEIVSIVGSSGAGKSTLLHILGSLDKANSGEIWINNQRIDTLKEKELAKFRNKHIGFVFQFHYLLNEFSVLKNVMLPGLKANKLSEQELEHQAYELLKKLGIEHLANKMAYQVSGGEKQRIAIARAMINDPLILMCDEPTGNLDSKNTDIVFDIFNELVHTFNKTLLVVTHNQNFADNTQRNIVIEDGRIIS